MSRNAKIVLLVVMSVCAVLAILWGMSRAGMLSGPVVIAPESAPDPSIAQDQSALRAMGEDEVKREYLARRGAVQDAVNKANDTALAAAEGALSRLLAEATRRKIVLPAQ
jgi:hypothetical protein